MPEVKVENVSFSYVPGYPVLSNISITFRPGATAVIGQNGAGKTTLMKLLNGLLKPLSGSVGIDGVDTRTVDTSEIAKRVGLVFQNPDAQIFKHKVRDEVEFGPLNIGRSAGDARELAMKALASVGLQHAIDENPYDLSYAERKMICVASILAMDTDIIVLDEPTISQDASGLSVMGGIIRTLKDRGKTVIGIVHDMNFAAEYFDEIVVMGEGNVLGQGPVSEIFQAEAVLSDAHVEPPAMGKLSLSVGLTNFSITPTDFVRNFGNQFMHR
jgi:energy-coupling factor transport system ATP-binding protein